MSINFGTWLYEELTKMTEDHTTDHPHYVAVTAQYRADGTELTPAVKFECRAAAGTGCRVYPACECESWDDKHGEDHGEGHEPVSHEECWLQGWFDGPSHCYAGDDYVEWFFMEAAK